MFERSGCGNCDRTDAYTQAVKDLDDYIEAGKTKGLDWLLNVQPLVSIGTQTDHEACVKTTQTEVPPKKWPKGKIEEQGHKRFSKTDHQNIRTSKPDRWNVKPPVEARRHSFNEIKHVQLVGKDVEKIEEDESSGLSIDGLVEGSKQTEVAETIPSPGIVAGSIKKVINRNKLMSEFNQVHKGNSSKPTFEPSYAPKNNRNIIPVNVEKDGSLDQNSAKKNDVKLIKDIGQLVLRGKIGVGKCRM